MHAIIRLMVNMFVINRFHWLLNISIGLTDKHDAEYRSLLYKTTVSIVYFFLVIIRLLTNIRTQWYREKKMNFLFNADNFDVKVCRRIARSKITISHKSPYTRKLSDHLYNCCFVCKIDFSVFEKNENIYWCYRHCFYTTGFD
jgi:hypothetical protein